MTRKVRRLRVPERVRWCVVAVVVTATLSSSPRVRHMAFSVLDELLFNEISEAKK